MSTQNIKEKKAIALEQKITATISSIKKGTVTPADSKIGVLFKQLRPLDEALYDKFIAEYKIIFQEYEKKNNSRTA